jgi:outer membrane protein OmpA-like peptidoglycan-associated protein
MRRFRSYAWLMPLLLCSAAAAGGLACKGQAELNVGSPPPPPPPPPPPLDSDGDGIPDTDDACPMEPEDGHPPDPNDGCPNKDLDGDGILIPDDKCPDAPETFNGFEDEDGCPDEKPLVQLKEKEVQINQKIQFKKNSANIEEESMPIIDAVADLLQKYPEVQLIEIGGHASKEGNANHNRTLTQQRVDSVVKALIQKGVEKERLLAQGYGFYCPMDTGDSEESLEKNRRVEFKILYRKGKDLEQTRGCEESVAKGIKPKKLPAIPAWAEAGSPPSGAEPGEAPPAPPPDAPAPTSAAPAPGAPAPSAVAPSAVAPAAAAPTAPAP